MSNSLSAVHPELIAEWSEKNLPLTPDNVTFGSNKKVWWKGACGHEWETSVKARSKGYGAGYKKTVRYADGASGRKGAFEKYGAAVYGKSRKGSGTFQE